MNLMTRYFSIYDQTKSRNKSIIKLMIINEREIEKQFKIVEMFSDVLYHVNSNI